MQGFSVPYQPTGTRKEEALKMAKIVLEGKIICIHHTTLADEMAPGLLNPENTPLSIIDVKVSHYEMRIIRPMREPFKWQRSLNEEIRSGKRIKITLELLEDS